MANWITVVRLQDGTWLSGVNENDNDFASCSVYNVLANTHESAIKDGKSRWKREKRKAKASVGQYTDEMPGEEKMTIVNDSEKISLKHSIEIYNKLIEEYNLSENSKIVIVEGYYE